MKKKEGVSLDVGRGCCTWLTDPLIPSLNDPSCPDSSACYTRKIFTAWEFLGFKGFFSYHTVNCSLMKNITLLSFCAVSLFYYFLEGIRFYLTMEGNGVLTIIYTYTEWMIIYLFLMEYGHEVKSGR